MVNWRKWCCVCGRRVDLRRKGAGALDSNGLRLCELSGIKNPEYFFVCSEKCGSTKVEDWGR